MTDKKKRILVSVIKMTAFLLVLLTVLYVLSSTAFSRGNAVTYKNKFANAYSFLKEPENTIEIVGVGDSNLYSGVVPVELWKKYGYTGTIMCAPLQTPAKSLRFLRQLFEKQSPKVVLIEASMFFKLSYNKNKKLIERDSDPVEELYDYMDPENFDEIFIGRFSIFTFHDKWKSDLKGEKSDYKDLNAHGYHLNVEVRKYKLEDYMVYTNEREPIRKHEYNGYVKLLEYCREQGAEPLLVALPAASAWSYARHNAVADFAKENGVDFLDFNTMLDEVKIVHNEHYRDRGVHLNYYGACLVTDRLGEYLKTHYKLEDLRGNPDYEFWNDSAAAFDADVAAEIENEKNRQQPPEEE